MHDLFGLIWILLASLQSLSCINSSEQAFSSQIFFLLQSATSSFIKPILLMFPSTYSLHFMFGWPVYIFHPFHVPLPSSKHLPQVISKHDHITSHHTSLPAYLLLPSISISTNPSVPLYSSRPTTLHCTLPSP